MSASVIRASLRRRFRGRCQSRGSRRRRSATATRLYRPRRLCLRRTRGPRGPPYRRGVRRVVHGGGVTDRHVRSRSVAGSLRWRAILGGSSGSRLAATPRWRRGVLLGRRRYVSLRILLALCCAGSAGCTATVRGRGGNRRLSAQPVATKAAEPHNAPGRPAHR